MDNAPTQLGKYKILNEIARGSMGIVYLGSDPDKKQEVAVKVAISGALNDEQSGEHYRRMFFNEAHTAGRLNHPNIVRIYDFGVDGEVCYIVMEFVDGGNTIKQYTAADHLLPVDKVVEMVFRCATALDYAHKQGVVHRDIKPTNILVTLDLKVKIADFSIAYVNKADTTGTQPIGMIGSPRYMSPEQISEDYLTSQTDLFSLGVVLYELLTGRHPFSADGFSRLIQKILNEPAPPPTNFRPDLPPELVRIVMKALEKERAQRYETGMQLASDLSRIYDHLLERPEEDVSAQEKFDSVKDLSFFQGFPDGEIWEIVRAGTWLEYEEGQAVITEGELDDSFFIIIRGEVVVRKGSAEFGVLVSGDCLGEMGYLAKTQRTASIIARSRSVLLKLNATVISQVSLVCQVRFLKVFLRTLINRLSATTERMSHEASTSV